ncbi:hypothetical protein J4443_03970 [Candidatus Woesearchaeota archaeon]|nr:hypothetical protein [Candidatus Woesearchaeota archaeon]
MNKLFKIMLIAIVKASLFDSSGDPINGNITIEIYDAETSGNLIYNSNGLLVRKNIAKTKEPNYG